ncbi:MAG: ChaB family protein [Acidimicrobiales bacterium]
MPAKKDMPSTVQRSSPKAQRTWGKTHDRAVDSYGEGERAHRTAFGALKHTHEKKGDRWVAKDEKGPSDPRSEQSTSDKRKGKGETYGGVDANGNTKRELYDRARNLDISGRSSMSKQELARAIGKKGG